jgi:hypothetical protein
MMTLTLVSKNLFLGLMLMTLISGASADYYYSDSGDYGITEDTGFSAPQYESQQEVMTKLVAPFLFVSIFLQILFNRALRFAFVDEGSGNDLISLVEDNKPNLRREAILMSITATAILVPTPFWDYVIFATASIPTVILSVAAIAVFYWGYTFLSRLF